MTLDGVNTIVRNIFNCDEPSAADYDALWNALESDSVIAAIRCELAFRDYARSMEKTMAALATLREAVK